MADRCECCGQVLSTTLLVRRWIKACPYLTFRRAEVVEQIGGRPVKEIDNALAYLARRKEIENIGYGQYGKNLANG